MSKLTIKSNYQARPLLYLEQFSDKDQEFIKSKYDWIDSSSMESWENAQFFKYKDWIYGSSDFMRIDSNSPFPKFWEGYLNDTFFFGHFNHIT